jgi:DNA-binding MarR family transcriptional regulator
MVFLWWPEEPLFMTDDAPTIQEALDDQIAELCRGVAHPHRIAILRGIQQDYALTTVATALDLSRSGVQTHVDTLVDTGLVVRTGDQQDPYHVTVLGDLGLQLVAQLYQPTQTVEDARQTAAAQANDELGEAPLPDAERDRAVHRRTWELVADAIDDADLEL